MQSIKYLIVLVALAFAGTASAGDQQTGATHFPLTKHARPTRGDGLYQHRASKTMVLIGNATGMYPMGATYRETFAYGDGIGIVCEVKKYNFILGGAGAGTNIACNTPCAALTPSASCIWAIDTDGIKPVTCDDAAGDNCICETPIRTASLDDDCADIEGSSGNIILLTFGQGVKLAYHPIIIQETAPDMDADSLDIGGDQNNDDGLELAGGIFGASGRPMIIGDDPGFQFCARVAIEDVTGTDDFWVGLRRVEEFNATWNAYDSYAAIGNISGTIYMDTELNGAAATSTSTTDAWADNGTKLLCVIVSDAGVVTYTINGQPPTVSAAFTFDDGMSVIPVIHFLQAADLTGEVDLTLWEMRYQ